MPNSKDNADYLIKQAVAAGIQSNKELGNFMGQMQIECAGFKSMHESLGYTGKRLLEVFPGRNGMDTIAEANAIAAGGSEAVANAIYGKPWGAMPGTLGNTEAGDGWKYHGRGYVQLTGRANYAAAGEALGLDLINNPDLAADREIAAQIAIHYWKTRVVPHGHQENTKEACHDINGGYKHLPERIAAAKVWENKLAHGYVKDNHLDGNQTPAMHYNGSQLEPVHKQSKADGTNEHAVLIASAEQNTHRLFKEASLDFANGGANTVASVTLLAAKHNITEIEHMSVQNGQINIAQKDPSGFGYNTASIDAVQAANTNKEQSLQALNQLGEQQSVQVQQTQHKTQTLI